MDSDRSKSNEPFELDDVVSALKARNFPLAESLLKAKSSTDPDSPMVAVDAYYLIAVLTMGLGAEEKGIALASQCVKAGKFSSKFSYYFGCALESLGDKGEAVRKRLQEFRLIPAHAVGFLGIEKNFNVIEPWYFSKAMVNLFPRNQSEFQDEDRLVEKYILHGWLPAEPLFTQESRILTLGSCFAQELRNYLAESGMSSDWLFVPPGLNNTFALRNFISWCLTGETATKAYWYDEGDQGGAIKWEDEGNRLSYAEAFRRVDGIILTVGLAEVWYDTTTGGVFWRGVPKSSYDETKHLCRVSTVEENEANLREIIRLIHAAKPGIPIVLTLSPVPLKAATGDKSCITVDTVSKSILRVAIDKIMSSGIDNAPGVRIVVASPDWRNP
jgi:hypothetical protein